MKIVRFIVAKQIKYGILKNNSIQVIKGKPYNQINLTDEYYSLSRVKLLAPCQPSKIVALGLNYVSHSAEFNHDIPKSPLIFLKPSTAVIGTEDNIIFPPSSKQVDYEAELGVVIKKKARQVAKEKAFEYVLGYVCFNDITARDQQQFDGQWTRAKSYDTFAAIGPWIETDVNPGNLKIEAYLNGLQKQKGNTCDLIFPVAELIHFISNIMTLLPGDVIATGTPSGVGPMKSGDVIEIKITSIGTLKNYVTSQY
ncbi:MAG: fumarylacetoacetate hydrolase family protein [Dehalococcoidales bacterium]|nr:fumarylacetoacetate hydrolase family protein [Dehalococcoidales bacterium]